MTQKPVADLTDTSTETGDPTSQPVPPQRDNAPVNETVPGAEDLSESSPNLSRIAWSITTLALLIAVVALAFRGDIGYAGVTLAVAIAAGINLF